MKHTLYPYAPSPYPLRYSSRGDGSFTQGFVAAGCISAFQNIAHPAAPENFRRVLRHSLQGGIALAAGSRTAAALHQNDYGAALLTVMTGAASVLLIENLLRDPAQPEQEPHHE